jgi:tetratricopeptide (TPR) repeat protein
MSRSNAVEKRLDRVTERWISFTDDSEARLLRWMVDPDNKQLIEAFITYEQEEKGDLPDLFIRFEAAFEKPSTYGNELVDLLREGYGESQEELNEAGIDTNWNCPEPNPDESDCAAFMRACNSLYEHYSDLMDYLAIVLTPSRVDDEEAWQAWLLRLVRQSIPEQVRFLVLDSAEAPTLDPLSEMEPVLITTGYPDLNMAGAMEEIAQSASDGSPEGQFRELLASINKAAQKGDVNRVEELAGTAIGLAREEEWWDMEGTVRMIVGSVQLSDDNPQQALENYRKGGDVAKKLDEDHPSRTMLRLQSCLAEGSVLFQMEEYVEAAEVYEGAAPLADEADNDYLKIEAWRMAGTCHEKSGQVADAWRCQEKALDAGEALDEDERLNSTLPHAGASLLSLASHRMYRDQRPAVKERLKAILGENWRGHLPEETAI